MSRRVFKAANRCSGSTSSQMVHISLLSQETTYIIGVESEVVQVHIEASMAGGALH